MPRLAKLILSFAAVAGLAACTIVPPRVEYVGPRVEIVRPAPYYAPTPYYAPPPYYYRDRRW